MIEASRDQDQRASRAQSAMIALQVFLANHIVLVVISWLTGKLFYDVPGKNHSLLALWHHWDVLWYIHLADHGYTWQGPTIQSDVAFFPLYPLAMHFLAYSTPLSAYTAGLLIANLSFAAALYLFHRLLVRDFDPMVAERTVTYLGLFPASLFFFTAYSESLYLLCCVGCMYGLRLRRWWVAGFCGMAAVLTRSLGLVLIVPFAVEIVDYWRSRPESWRVRYMPLAALAMLPGALLCFMVYLQLRFGDALLFARTQAAWQRTLAVPWQGPLLDIAHISNLPGIVSVHTRGALQALSLLDLFFLLLFLLLLSLSVCWLPRAYTAYAGAVMLAILINPAGGRGQPLALLSLSRFEVTLFPPFIVLGILGRARGVDRIVLGLSLSLLALFTIVFVRGRWIA